jgi:glycosyltransferase involved in cell wall biosynthesis
MKIFHCVESYYPSVGGMQEVVKQLSERLVKLGHDVTVLTRYNPERNFDVLNGVKIRQFKIEGNPKAVESANEQEYVDFLLSNTSDIITFFAAQQWATDLALPVLKKLQAKKVSVPTGYSGLYWPQFKSYFEDMRTWIHSYDMNVYLSNDYRDINFARENKVKHMTIIPNGAGEDEFLADPGIDIRSELKIPKDHFLILHVGSYTGWKGHRETIEIFLRSDLKNATLLMIGNNHEHFKEEYLRHPLLALLRLVNKISGNKKIIFTYVPRPFTVAAYKEADLFLFPSNIECSPIVLFECAAARLPFLSSDAGNSKEISEWTRGGEIIPTTRDKNGFSHVSIKAGIRMLNELFRDQGKRKKMAETAFEIWKRKYSWEVIAKEYENLYLSLLKK